MTIDSAGCAEIDCKICELLQADCYFDNSLNPFPLSDLCSLAKVSFQNSEEMKEYELRGNGA